MALRSRVLSSSLSRSEISQKSLRLYGTDLNVDRWIDKGECYTIKSSSGLMLFVKCGDQKYKTTMLFDLDSVTVGEAAQDGNDAFRWMFENTDAQTLVAYVPSDSPACNLMAPFAYGGRLDKSNFGQVLVVEKSSFLKSSSEVSVKQVS